MTTAAIKEGIRESEVMQRAESGMLKVSKTVTVDMGRTLLDADQTAKVVGRLYTVDIPSTLNPASS